MIGPRRWAESVYQGWIQEKGHCFANPPFGRIMISTYNGRPRSSCYDESRPLIAALACLMVRVYVEASALGPNPRIQRRPPLVRRGAKFRLGAFSIG